MIARLKQNFNTRYNPDLCLNKAIKLSINASVGHNPTYTRGLENTAKAEIKNFWEAKLESLSEIFSVAKDTEFYLDFVNEFKQEMNKEYLKLFSPNHKKYENGFRIAHSQKSISVCLKHLWCLGIIPEPPCCPVDRIISVRAGVNLNENWTQMNSINSLRETLSRFSEIAKDNKMSIAVWELALFPN